MNFSRLELLKAIEAKGYIIFTKGDYNLNIIGIRSKNSKSDEFDDMIYVFYKYQNQWFIESFPCTTDPGKHWLLNPLNKNGTIIMVPGQYRGAYEIGMHGRSGKYPYTALEQIKPIDYVRDNNKDIKLDFDLYSDSSNIFSDIAKTNIHRASSWKLLLGIGKYSAGCQVIQDPKKFDRFMELCELQKAHGNGNSFTYTLLEERDIEKL